MSTLVLAGEGGERSFDAGQLGLRPDGGFRVEVPPGAWTVTARSPEHSTSEAQSVRIAAGGSASVPKLVLIRTGILRGTVLLPPAWRSRLPYTFRIVLEVSGDEAAEMLEVSPANYRQIVHRARASVRRCTAAKMEGAA